MDINLEDYFARRKNFSGNVLISKDNKIIFNQSYGYANVEKEIKNTAQTQFMIGSMTKTITALCIMQLMEKEILSVKQNIEDYFPNLYKGYGITIHHLLNHTSGLPNFVLLKRQIKWAEQHTPEEILKMVQSHKSKFPCGTKWSYSNTNYLILGLIIEKVSGISYHDYVKNNIFTPAKMGNSSFINEEQKNLANNYINGKQGFRMDPSMFFACGDVVSTVGDLYLLDRAIQDGVLLNPQTVNEMQKPHYNGKNTKYGYGLFLKNFFDRKSICHSGSVPSGYTSHFEKYVDDNLFIVVLSNNLEKYTFLLLKDFGGTYINREIASLIYGKKLGVLEKML